MGLDDATLCARGEIPIIKGGVNNMFPAAKAGKAAKGGRKKAITTKNLERGVSIQILKKKLKGRPRRKQANRRKSELQGGRFTSCKERG